MVLSPIAVLLALLQLNLARSIRRAGSSMILRAPTAIYSTKDVIDNKETDVEANIVALNASDKKVQRPIIELNALELCLCGAFATAFGDFCVHPIDTIKVTQQSAGF